jgi:hypothetical protein
MNNNPRVNSSKSKSRCPDSLHEFAQDFGDSKSTSWAFHSHDLVHQNLLNKRNRRNPTQNASNPREEKTPNRVPLLTELGGESKGNEPRRVHAYIPHQIPKRKVSKPPQENRQEKALKITKKGKKDRQNQALRNHAKSPMHTMKVQTRSSLPPNHPSISQDLTMKLSS